MRYIFKYIKKSIFSQVQPESKNIENPIVAEPVISRGFILGSGRTTPEVKKAFKALSALVIPALASKKDYFSALKSISSSQPFETKTINRKKITCFVFNEVCYEIPMSAGEFKSSLIDEANIFDKSWGEGNTFTQKNITDFDKFLSDFKIVSVSDYDNFQKNKIYVNVANKLYYLFPRIQTGEIAGLKEILKSKLSLKSTVQKYSGEALTKEVLNNYLSENDFNRYYNLIDSTDHRFAAIENFYVTEQGQEVLDKYSKINFTDLKEIIEKNYFFDDPLKEHLVYIYLINSEPYYNPIRSIQKEQIRRSETLRKITDIYGEGDPVEHVKKFRNSLDNLLQDLAFISESKKSSYNDFYHLLSAIFSIKFFYFRDRNVQKSDKIDINNIKAHTFDTDILSLKPDFLLMPLKQYQSFLPIILIEFDGEQHFLPKFGRNFVRIKIYDAIKNNFFENTPGYGIIRIPFTLVKDSPTKDYRPAIMEYIKPKMDSFLNSKISEIRKVANKVFNFKKFNFKI